MSNYRPGHCGALADLDYRITDRDPDGATATFQGGKLGPWIARLGVRCTASVRQVGDRESEIVITGDEDLEDRVGGVWVFPYQEGMAMRTTKIFDLVAATVISYSVIDAAASVEP